MLSFILETTVLSESQYVMADNVIPIFTLQFHLYVRNIG